MGDEMPVVLPIVLSLFFVAGAVMLFFPLMIYRTGGSVYTEEFLNKFGTRVTTRALGVLFMLFCTAILAPILTHTPELSKGLFASNVCSVRLALGVRVRHGNHHLDQPESQVMDGGAFDR